MSVLANLRRFWQILVADPTRPIERKFDTLDSRILRATREAERLVRRSGDGRR